MLFANNLRWTFSIHSFESSRFLYRIGRRNDIGEHIHVLRGGGRSWQKKVRNTMFQLFIVAMVGVLCSNSAVVILFNPPFNRFISSFTTKHLSWINVQSTFFPRLRQKIKWCLKCKYTKWIRNIKLHKGLNRISFE